MCYLNGTTDRDYTLRNRQAAHKYGKITLLADKGDITTEVFEDYNQQIEIERRLRKVREDKFKGKATIYLTFQSRMDTKKAISFLDDVAEKVGFTVNGRRIGRLASTECS